MSRYSERIRPAYWRNVGTLQRDKARVIAACPVCQNFFKVNLERIERYKGSDFSLIDQHPPCPILKCDGHLNFLVSPCEGTPFRPLV